MLRLAIALCVFPAFAHAEVTVFAAASLKTALDEIAEGWDEPVTISYAGSSQLARQIQEGAPADLFVSAAVDWMDVLEKDGRIVTASRKDLLGNTLVLVGEAGAAATKIAALPTVLGDDKLAMALVDSVPAGVYGKEALTSLGLWDKVADHVAQADNVRAALALVATGEAPFGIVYGSDAVAESRVAVVATFPEESHAPITYPAAVIDGSDEAAARFLEHLSSPEAAAIFTAQGFSVLP